jgi:hypothetical protein
MGWYMLFIGRYGSGGQSPTIWQSDGTEHGTIPINASVGVNFTCINPLAAAGGSYFFYSLLVEPPKCSGKIYAQSTSGQLLVWDTHASINAQGIAEAAPLQKWTHDVYEYTENDNPAGTVLDPQGFTLYNGRVYFNGTFGGASSEGGVLLISVQELFTTDHLQMIPGPGGVGAGLNPTSLTVAFNTLFFAGNDPVSGNNVLFAYDGSATPATAPGIDVNSAPFSPAYLTFFSNSATLFMNGQDSAGNQWLWRYDGANPPVNIDPTSSGLQPYNLVSYPVTYPFECQGVELQIGQQILFFSGVRDDGKRGLWMSLGTKETTQEIPTPTPSSPDNSTDGSTSVYPFNLTVLAPYLCFTAYDTYINGFPSGRGLFAYDALTNRLSEPYHSSTVNFDPESDIPSSGGLSQITMTGPFPGTGDLYFSGADGGNADLWRVRPGIPAADGIGAQSALPPTAVYSGDNFDLCPMSPTYQWI